MNFFARNLRFLRKNFSITQSELASQLKVGQTTIGNWETGYTEPDIDNLIKINHFFAISIDYLIFIDLPKSKLIEESNLVEFKRKSKVNSKVSPKVIGPSPLYYISSDQPQNILNEDQATYMWSVMKEIKIFHEKLDAMRLLLESEGKSNP